MQPTDSDASLPVLGAWAKKEHGAFSVEMILGCGHAVDSPGTQPHVCGQVMKLDKLSAHLRHGFQGTTVWPRAGLFDRLRLFIDHRP